MLSYILSTHTDTHTHKHTHTHANTHTHKHTCNNTQYVLIIGATSQEYPFLKLPDALV